MEEEERILILYLRENINQPDNSKVVLISLQILKSSLKILIFQVCKLHSYVFTNAEEPI